MSADALLGRTSALIFDSRLNEAAMVSASTARSIVEHYWQTGTFRPQDLRRLPGDPTKGGEVTPNTNLGLVPGSLSGAHFLIQRFPRKERNSFGEKRRGQRELFY
jgi:hypothetical protein